jgi:hypothetical protein
VVAIVVAALAALVVLAMREGREPASAPNAASAPGSTPLAQNEPKATRDEGVQTVLPARPAEETALRPEAVYATPNNSGNAINSAASPAAETPSVGTVPPEAISESAALQASAVEKPVPPAPLLYIHVRSDAQRAYAEHMIEPLARQGIRVSGIKVVSVGPPVSDLRYFRSADRAEALRINRALDVVGAPAQRLKYIARAEEAPERQYELWLPAFP